MRNKMLFFLFFCFAFYGDDGFGYHLKLVNELNCLYEEDQKIRSILIESGDLNSKTDLNKIRELDAGHLVRLKEIIEEFGWPGYSLVGEEGSEKMWLLVQHCDEDRDFQKSCLHLLEKAVIKQEASKKCLAYLKDRVAVHEGQVQLYGTQFQIMDGQLIPYPIESLEQLDSRRAEMGLGSFQDYLLTLKEIYLK